MWKSAGHFRQVEIEMSTETLLRGSPVVQTSCLVEIASSLCQSWGPTSSINAITTASETNRKVKVNLGSMFREALPFNVSLQLSTASDEISEWVSRYCLLSQTEPDFEKMAADSGHNLLRLITIIAKYHGHSQWRFVADTQLDGDSEGGLAWLRTVKAKCAQYDMLLEDIICK